MDTIRAKDGAYLLNSNQFYYNKDALGRPVLNVVHTETEPVITTDFVITLTEHENGTYTADKAWVDIKAAYDEKENIVVDINGSRLPMMSASVVASGDANFYFGYTTVTPNGQLVSTRAVEYTYLSTDGSESWVDADEAGEYVKPDDIANMVTKKVLHQAKNTGSMFTLANGVYMLVACDAGHSGVATINVSGDAFTVSHVSTLSSWTVTKGAVANGVFINNLSTTTDLDVYVVSI